MISTIQFAICARYSQATRAVDFFQFPMIMLKLSYTSATVPNKNVEFQVRLTDVNNPVHRRRGECVRLDLYMTIATYIFD